MTEITGNANEILASLGYDPTTHDLEPRGGLTLTESINSLTSDYWPLLILRDDAQGDAILGAVGREFPGSAFLTLYVACIECAARIEDADAGMCRPCREDLAWAEGLADDMRGPGPADAE